MVLFGLGARRALSPKDCSVKEISLVWCTFSGQSSALYSYQIAWCIRDNDDRDNINRSTEKVRPRDKKN